MARQQWRLLAPVLLMVLGWIVLRTECTTHFAPLSSDNTLFVLSVSKETIPEQNTYAVENTVRDKQVSDPVETTTFDEGDRKERNSYQDKVVFHIQPRIVNRRKNNGKKKFSNERKQHNKRRKQNKRKKQNRRKHGKKKRPVNAMNKESPNSYRYSSDADKNQESSDGGGDSVEDNVNEFADYKDYTNYGKAQEDYESKDYEIESTYDSIEPISEEDGAVEYPDSGLFYNDRLPGPNTGLRLDDTIAGTAFFAQGTAGLHGKCQLPAKPGTFQQSEGKCNHISQCVNWWKRNSTFIKSNCEDGQHSLTVCCIEHTNHRDPDRKDYPAFSGVNIDSSVHVEVKVRDLEEAIDKGREEWSQISDSKQIPKDVAIKDGVKTPEAMYATFTKPQEESIKLGTGALNTTFALSELAKSKHLRRTEAGFGLNNFNLFNTTLGSSCVPKQDITCNPNYPYRSFDGSCNNLLKPYLGRANTAYSRLLPPNYADGIYAPPSSVGGGVLPSPHQISNHVVTEKLKKNDDFNGLHSTWWQFMSYDLAKTPTFRLKDGSGIQCCKGGKLLSAEMRHPMCFPIQMTGLDASGRNCMNFVRSVPAPRTACNLGYTEQLNEATHFLDLSNVYGTSKTEADSLRTMSKGMLQYDEGDECKCELLPESKDGCYDRASGKRCFKTGDARSNASPLLIVLYTLFVRRHNLLAKRLYELNPVWDDERLYQEARKIVIAEYQHITYEEWLDYLGVVSPWRFKPYVRHMEKPVRYNPDLDPSLPTELPTAVLRAAQAMILDTVESHSLKPHHTTLYSTPIENTFYNVTYLRNDDELSHLLIAMNERREDHLRGKYNQGLHHKLFQTGDYPGFDLLALNIQRGRDHGLRPWNDYRELCGFKRYEDWGDLRIRASHMVKKQLQSVYKSVNDIDLLTGLSIEKQEETFTCLLLNGVRRLREADRFYYKNTGHPGSFTEEQIAEIDKTTSARFLCSVSGLEKVNKVPFYYPSRRFWTNHCSTYGDIDLEPWRDVVVQTWHGKK